jgi:hypothetical protein
MCVTRRQFCIGVAATGTALSVPLLSGCSLSSRAGRPPMSPDLQRHQPQDG